MLCAIISSITGAGVSLAVLVLRVLLESRSSITPLYRKTFKKKISQVLKEIYRETSILCLIRSVKKPFQVFKNHG